MGNLQNAIHYYKLQLNIAHQLDDRIEIKEGYDNLGSVYVTLGKYNEAITYHTSCLAMAVALNDKRGEANSCCRLGVAYFSLGKYREASHFWLIELRIALEIGYKEGEQAAYGNLGNAFQLVGKYSEAAEHFEKLLDMAKDTGDRKTEANAYGGLGQAYESMGRLAKANEYYEQSLMLTKKIGDKQGEAYAYGLLGNACKTSKKYDDAIQYYKKGLSIKSQIGDKKGEGSTHFNIGLCYKLKCNMKKSKDHLEKSVSCCEQMFKGLEDNDQLKIPIVDTYIEAYKTLSQVCIDSGQTDKAILVSERGRSRALEDILGLNYSVNQYNMPGSGSLELLPQGVYDIIDMSAIDFSIIYYDVSLQKDYVQIWVTEAYPNPSFCVRSNIVEYSSSSDEETSEINKETNLNNIIETSYVQMKTRNAVNCEDRSLGAINITQKSTTFAVAKSGETTENVDKSDKGSSKGRCIFEFDDEESPLMLLFEMLISPVEDKLIEDELVIVPDGPLYKVPFAALQNPKTGKFLSENKCIRLIPSLTTLKIIQESSYEHQNMTGALIVGNPHIGKVKYRGIERSFPTLLGAEDEANSIAKLLGVEPLSGIKATKQTILERLAHGVSVVHFAAHGEAENGQILLAPSTTRTSNKVPEENDYILTVGEAQQSGLCTQLVVLSCCHSGKGDIRSEGVVGMARAFLASGARAVVASLWAIDDNATKLFMLKFYSHLIEGESASKSLQLAMKGMRESSIYSDPMYWSAFFLVGDDVTLNITTSNKKFKRLRNRVKSKCNLS